MKDKVWKIYSRDENYRISEDGHIARKINGLGWSYIEQSLYSNGYMHVCIGERKDRKTVPVHLMVAETFHGLRPEGCECHHKDTNKQNNKAGNLEWITVSKHRSLTGRPKKYNNVKVVSLKVDEHQYEKLHTYATELGFPSLSHLIKACINKGLPLVKRERNSTDN